MFKERKLSSLHKYLGASPGSRNSPWGRARCHSAVSQRTVLYRSNARVQWDAVGDSASDFVGECAVGGCEGDEDKLAGVVQEASVSDLSPGPS